MKYILTPSTVITDEHIKYIQSTTGAYPKIYGNELPEGAEYIETIILNFKDDPIVWDSTVNNNGQMMNDPTNTAQKVRAEGNPEEPNIKKGLESKGDPGGYDIRDVGGRIRMYQDEKGHYQFADGRTKARLMKSSDYKGMPVDLYQIRKRDNGKIDLSVVRKMGSLFNQIKYAAGIVTKQDIQKIILDDYNDGILQLKDPSDIDNYGVNYLVVIAEAKQHGGATFYMTTYQKITTFVLNALADSDNSSTIKTAVRLQYDESKAKAKLAQMGVYKDNQNNNGIFYLAVSASTISGSFTQSAAKCAALEEVYHDEGNTEITNFKELRILFHSGIINSSDFVQSAKDIIDKGRNDWSNTIKNISSSFFNNSDKSSKVVLYGCFPFDQSVGYDIDKIIPFTKPNKDNPDLSLIGSYQEPIYFYDIDKKKTSSNSNTTS